MLRTRRKYSLWLFTVCSCSRLKVKGPNIYILSVMGNPDQQQFTIEVAYLLAMTLGGAAQLAAAHCPNERSLDTTVCYIPSWFTHPIQVLTSTVHGRQSNSRPVDHKSDALTTTLTSPPSLLLLVLLLCHMHCLAEAQSHCCNLMEGIYGEPN